MRPYLFWFYRLMSKRNILIIAACGALAMAATRAEEPPPAPVKVTEVSKTPLPFNMLTSAEQEFYHNSFNYAMDTLADNTTYEWRAAKAFGTITAGRHYISKSQSNCRNFSETYTFGSSAGYMDGVGCKRKGSEGWCKLRAGDMLSCAFEPPETIFDMIEMQANKAVDITNNSTNRAKWSIQKWWPF